MQAKTLTYAFRGALPVSLLHNDDQVYDLCMLYIVGGCSRSGKSILASRMHAHHGIPWFSLGALKMSLQLGAPTLGVMAAGDDLDTADQMWPFVEPILDHAIFDRRDYLVEGVNLRPTTVARYMRELEAPVRVCFLGYPDIDIKAKASAVERHVHPPADWLHRTGIEHVRSISLAVENSVARYAQNVHCFAFRSSTPGLIFKTASMQPSEPLRVCCNGRTLVELRGEILVDWVERRCRNNCVSLRS